MPFFLDPLPGVGFGSGSGGRLRGALWRGVGHRLTLTVSRPVHLGRLAASIGGERANPPRARDRQFAAFGFEPPAASAIKRSNATPWITCSPLFFEIGPLPSSRGSAYGRRAFRGSPMPPLQLTDDEMSVLRRLAEPLDQQRRQLFLEEVAAELEAKRQAGEIGEGVVHRVARVVQRRFFDPPEFPNAAGRARA